MSDYATCRLSERHVWVVGVDKCLREAVHVHVDTRECYDNSLTYYHSITD